MRYSRKKNTSTVYIKQIRLNKTHEHVIDTELESLKEQCKHAEKEFQKAGVGLGKTKADSKTAGDIYVQNKNKNAQRVEND